jgi:hypothetical protein
VNRSPARNRRRSLRRSSIRRKTLRTRSSEREPPAADPIRRADRQRASGVTTGPQAASSRGTRGTITTQAADCGSKCVGPRRVCGPLRIEHLRARQRRGAAAPRYNKSPPQTASARGYRWNR